MQLNCFSCVRLCATLWTVTAPPTAQALSVALSMGFSRQEHWSELPCPPPGDLPDPGIKPTSLMAPALQVDSLPLSHWGSPLIIITTILKSSVFIILKIHSLFLFKSKPSEKLKKKKIKICLPLNHCGPVWDFTVQ